MAFTNTREEGLEALIVKWLVEQNGYEQGTNDDYSKEYALDETRLFRFLSETQPDEMDKLGVFKSDTKRRQFLNRLQGELAKRGIIDVLRNGIKVYPADLIMFYLTPTENNQKQKAMYEKNIFSVTRQLRYSQDAGKLALDLCIFINGLPVITMELKNQLTKQNTEYAVQQYKDDRDPRDILFSFKRCMVHFAVDDATIKFCTKLAGKDSWFLPFNKGYNDGAGNPPNPDGLMTDYLWKDILTKAKLSRIIENYAQVVEEVDEDTKKKSVMQIFPRYHQLDVVEKLLADVRANGVGKRYLIQHSAGSGKSNSIAWLAHQLIGIEQNGRPLIDSVLVVTDRRILDKQIRNTIKQFMQVKNTVVWAEHSGDLRKAIQDGKRIIVTTVEKFPYIVTEIGQEHKTHKFAVIIDEAHSGQSGRNSAQMNLALSGLASEDDMDNEDRINAMMEGRKLLTTASYFAFTATPKNKTEETFGVAYEEDGEIKHRPFHVYTMKQAIQEGFILDVLKYYTPIDSYYKLMKTVDDDPMFDKKRAQKKLRSFVESNEVTISKKAAMMVDHFHEQVIAKRKIGGQARAMVVTASIPRCIEYYYAISKCLADRRSPYKAIVAFSGEHKYKGQEPALTSSDMNGFSDALIPKTFKKDPFRILIVADMFQTGFDEPLLHTMYVDKPLYDIGAVQTLSRLNRAYPGKDDTFVLDFANKTSVIEESFSKYYRTTILSGETDPNKLYDLIAVMEDYQVYCNDDVERLVDLFLSGAERDRLDPTLDACTAVYKQLEMDDQIKFKSSAKAFVRTYGFLGAILPYGNVEWEKLSIFLNLLIPKLPSPREDDLSEGILSTIDLSSYRNEAREMISIRLEDQDAEIAPVPAGKAGHIVEPEMDLLSRIISDFNDMFGNINWNDADNVQRQILEIPAMVSRDKKYQNAMRNSDEQSARLESERALQQVIFSIMADNMELFKQFQDNPSFKKWLSDLVFHLTYNPEGKEYIPTKEPQTGIESSQKFDNHKTVRIIDREFDEFFGNDYRVDPTGVVKTFRIPQKLYRYLLRNNKTLASYIESEQFIYLEETGYVCLNHPIFLKILYINESPQLTLSDYGRNHISECCIQFAFYNSSAESNLVPLRKICLQDYSDIGSLYSEAKAIKAPSWVIKEGDYLTTKEKDDKQQFLIDLEKRFRDIATDEDEKKNAQIIISAMRKGKTSVSFADAVRFHMKNTGTTIDKLSKNTGISVKTIKSYRDDPDKSIPIENVMAVCHGLHLSYYLSMDLLEIAGHSLSNYNNRNTTYKLLLSDYRNHSLDVWNEILKAKQLNPIPNTWNQGIK